MLLLGGAALVALIAGLVITTLAAYRPTRDERFALMPGDRWIAQPMFVTTQAVTVPAPVERVWPWIAQMGAGRAGWYSYDAIDNGGTPSATVILSAYQHLEPGDLLSAVPGSEDAFIVLAVDPPRDLVLGGPLDRDGHQRVSWEFLLRPLPEDRARLIVRGRVAATWLSAPPRHDPRRAPFFIERVYGAMAHIPRPILMIGAGFGHRVMQNAQLRGLKRRVAQRAS